jgi:hypothetical protein
LPVQVVYALAFVWFGNSLADNAAWRVALGAALLVAIALAVGLLRRWLKGLSGTAERPTR